MRLSEIEAYGFYITTLLRKTLTNHIINVHNYSLHVSIHATYATQFMEANTVCRQNSDIFQENDIGHF